MPCARIAAAPPERFTPSRPALLLAAALLLAQTVQSPPGTPASGAGRHVQQAVPDLAMGLPDKLAAAAAENPFSEHEPSSAVLTVYLTGEDAGFLDRADDEKARAAAGPSKGRANRTLEASRTSGRLRGLPETPRRRPGMGTSTSGGAVERGQARSG